MLPPCPAQTSAAPAARPGDDARATAMAEELGKIRRTELTAASVGGDR